jgi:hypothetical protein
MVTKKDYEDAIKKIREAFYSSICDEWALEQIAVNLDFLSSLINEHFEEKQETNYEHYEDEIIELYIENLAISNGKLTQCEYDMLDTIFEKEARFSTVYLIGELKKKGYFENIKCDSKVLVKDILANCEVIE